MNTQTYLLHTVRDIGEPRRGGGPNNCRRERLCRIDHKTLLSAVRRFEFTRGSYFEGHDRVTIEVQNGCVMATKNRVAMYSRSNAERRVLSKREWERFIDRLFSELQLHTWAPDYRGRAVPDGAQWSVTVTLGTGEQIRTGGCNAFPTCWAAFTGCVNELFLPGDAQSSLRVCETPADGGRRSGTGSQGMQSKYRYLEFTEDPDAFLMALE